MKPGYVQPHDAPRSDGVPSPPPYVEIFPLRANRRPIGFAPWPKEKKRRKKRG